MAPEKHAAHSVRWLAQPLAATAKAVHFATTTCALLKQIALWMKITSHFGVRSTSLPRASGQPSQCTWSSQREAERNAEEEETQESGSCKFGPQKTEKWEMFVKQPQTWKDRTGILWQRTTKGNVQFLTRNQHNLHLRHCRKKPFLLRELLLFT